MGLFPSGCEEMTRPLLADSAPQLCAADLRLVSGAGEKPWHSPAPHSGRTQAFSRQRLARPRFRPTRATQDRKPVTMPPSAGARHDWRTKGGKAFGLDPTHSKVNDNHAGAPGWRESSAEVEAPCRAQPRAGPGLGFAAPQVVVQPRGKASNRGAAQRVPYATLPLGAPGPCFVPSAAPPPRNRSILIRSGHPTPLS